MKFFESTVCAIPLLATFTGLAIQTVQAFGPKTESEKKEVRYTECLLAMETADTNNDHQLSREEYQPFVHSLARLLFGGDSPLTDDGALPEELKELYEPLVKVSGVPKDDNKVHHIDIFGANLQDLNSVQDDRIKALHHVCEDTMHALAKLGPQTEAPLMFVHQEHQLDVDYGDAFKDDDWDSMEDSQMISIHTSFVVSNFKGLGPRDVDLTHDGVLWNAVADFVIKALEEDPTAPIDIVNDDDYALKGDDDSHYDDDGIHREDDAVLLDTADEGDDAVARGNETSVDPVEDGTDSEDLGDTTDAEGEEEATEDEEEEATDSAADETEEDVVDEESRHHSNDEEHRGRRLHLGGNQHAVLEDLELYEIHETKCPAIHHHSGPMPLCQIVFAHFDVLISHLDGNLHEIEKQYRAMVKHGIEDGLLQESVDATDKQEHPDFHIEGAGAHAYPLENMHHTDGEGRRGRSLLRTNNRRTTA